MYRQHRFIYNAFPLNKLSKHLLKQISTRFLFEGTTILLTLSLTKETQCQAFIRKFINAIYRTTKQILCTDNSRL